MKERACMAPAARAQFQGCIICVDGVVLTPWKSFSGVFAFEVGKLDSYM